MLSSQAGSLPRVTRAAASVALVAALLLLALAGDATACPGCAEAVGEQPGDVARGFYWSILFMIGMPFTLAGGLFGYVAYASRRAGAEREGEASS